MKWEKNRFIWRVARKNRSHTKLARFIRAHLINKLFISLIRPVGFDDIFVQHCAVFLGYLGGGLIQFVPTCLSFRFVQFTFTLNSVNLSVQNILGARGERVNCRMRSQNMNEMTLIYERDTCIASSALLFSLVHFGFSTVILSFLEQIRPEHWEYTNKKDPLKMSKNTLSIKQNDTLEMRNQ